MAVVDAADVREQPFFLFSSLCQQDSKVSKDRVSQKRIRNCAIKNSADSKQTMKKKKKKRKGSQSTSDDRSIMLKDLAKRKTI